MLYVLTAYEFSSYASTADQLYDFIHLKLLMSLLLIAHYVIYNSFICAHYL